MKDPSKHLGDILESCAAIRAYTNGLSRDEFFRDPKTKDAVCMRIIAIAESAKKLLDSFPDTKNKKAIPWREIADMRNRIAHDYGGVDYGIVWEVCKNDIPNLELLIKNTQ